jgi:hypothetical protein
MPSVACIVEGHGDRLSIPIILRRVAEREGIFDLNVVGPFRIPRSTLVRTGELERAVERAARSLAGQGGILVVIDADDDLPCQIGPMLRRRAAAARRDVSTCVVVANREKEAWYLASIESLRGRRGIPEDATPPANAEAIRDAKRWLARVMGRSYSEVADQPALSQLFDLDLARAGARSFGKFDREARLLLSLPTPKE